MYIVLELGSEYRHSCKIQHYAFQSEIKIMQNIVTLSSHSIQFYKRILLLDGKLDMI